VVPTLVHSSRRTKVFPSRKKSQRNYREALSTIHREIANRMPQK
jgi:hypothetical protein